MRTPEQNKRLWGLLTAFEMENDDEGRSQLAYYFSHGKTNRTSELTFDECNNLINHLKSMLPQWNAETYRLRWRLRYLFAQSKYDQFCINGDKTQPDLKNIDAFTSKHWHKNVDKMRKKDLTRYIAIVQRWI